MKNHFQNDRSQVKTKICDEDLPMVDYLHTGFRKFAHQYEQVRKTFLNLGSVSKMIRHGLRSLSQIGSKTGRKTNVEPDMQFHMDSKA